MTPPIIKQVLFVDVHTLPEVHSDSRRTIYETVGQTAGGAVRTTRSVVTADEVVLGNHYHDFAQTFRGRGEGMLYTAPKDDPSNISQQALPPSGWAFTIPAGMVAAFRLKKGATMIFESSSTYKDGANTHRVVIAL